MMTDFIGLEQLGERAAGEVRPEQFDPAYQVDPYPTYRQLRKKCPIGKSNAYGGFYYLST